MYSDKELMKIWFYGLETIGAVTRGKLLGLFNNIENIFNLDRGKLREHLSRTQYDEICVEHTLGIMLERTEALRERNIKIIHFESGDYPEKLRNIYDPPGIIYVKGSFSDTVDEEKRNIAIVGSRNADAYGIELAGMFARELAKKKINIISGLAMGIDGEAHKGTLNAGGYSLGVLGCGINVTYPPQNAELFSLMEKKGGIISEHYLNVKPMPYNFPRRNRIISALSDGVLVVEAGKKSGSLITTDFALEQGKQVYAVPGRVYDKVSEGTNRLIKQGAVCVTEPEDILLDLLGTGVLSEQAAKKGIEEKALAPTEKMVYSCLSLNPTYIEDIIDKAGLSVTEAINCLYGLEKKGVIKQTVRGYYIISI